MEIDTTPELVSNVYQKLKENIVKFRDVVERPLTLTEKILSGHFNEISEKNLSGGKDYVFLKPDRVALQDVTGQMVMLQFMQAELNETALPTTVHCDHLIRAEVQGDVDMKVSLDENSEVFKFLQSACAKYGCGFWKPGAGIIHQVVLENYELTVSGGTNAIVEYFGPGTSSISCTGKATITNMGAEIGATCSIFPYDERMETYLKYTNRKEIAELANQNKELLVADPEIESEPEKYFDKIIEIDLSTLEPHIVGPHTPDLARSISELADDVTSNDYVDPISVALIGSCTNSSYEDMSRAASLAKQAKSKGIKSKIPLLVTPGSEQIRGTIERDGQMDSLKEIGATVLANACGPCIGQWNRPELEKNEKNSIVTTFNRNFPGRNDGQRSTLNFIGSPEMIIALALGGKLSFNPLKDDLVAADGTKFKLEPPTIAPEVPEEGFKIPDGIFVAPPSDSTNVDVVIDPNSKRLQRLAPFEKWNGNDFVELPIMVKAKGKCTTDHISPAGAWLSLRGHLDNLSDNMLLGAVNAFNDEVGSGKNILNNEIEPFSKIARQYKQQGLNWIIIGDNNYGEGSSREHAAMTPRYLGCVAVITKSLARIHETNLKKQGVLALTFNDPNDYEKILEDDKISLINLDSLEPQKQVTCVITHSDGNKEEILLNHSYNESQIQWFKHGSALNVLRNKK